PPALDELKVLVAGGTGTVSTDPGVIQRDARGLGDWLARSRGVRGRTIQVPPYQNPHVGWMRNILNPPVGLGAAPVERSALPLGAMVNGLVVQQRRQIGILKAVGAGSSRVVQVFLAMVLLLAAAATALAFVPGIALGRVLARMVLRGQLNMDVASYAAPW